MPQLERLLDADHQQKEVLAQGRLAGVAARQTNAQHKKEALLKAIADLFDKPDKPGWRWTNKQITDYLKPRFPYARSTTMRLVNLEVAKLRKR
jgi:hypothetical protein